MSCLSEWTVVYNCDGYLSILVHSQNPHSIMCGLFMPINEYESKTQCSDLKKHLSYIHHHNLHFHSIHYILWLCDISVLILLHDRLLLFASNTPSSNSKIFTRPQWVDPFDQEWWSAETSQTCQRSTAQLLFGYKIFKWKQTQDLEKLTTYQCIYAFQIFFSPVFLSDCQTGRGRKIISGGVARCLWTKNK